MGILELRKLNHSKGVRYALTLNEGDLISWFNHANLKRHFGMVKEKASSQIKRGNKLFTVLEGNCTRKIHYSDLIIKGLE